MMVIDVYGRLVIDCKYAAGQPFLESGCGSCISVVLLRVPGCFAGILYADEVEITAVIEFLLKSGGDDIIRRANDPTGITDNGRIVVYAAKRTDVCTNYLMKKVRSAFSV
jgi:hypothetical protein